MKRMTILIASAIVVILTGAVLLHSQFPPRRQAAAPRQTITAIGEATVTGQPDSVRAYFGVVTTAKTVPAARAENARVVAKVQKAIRALQLSSLKSKTQVTSVERIYDAKDRSRIIGYQASQEFTVVVQEAEPQKLGKIAAQLLDAGLQNGVNRQGHVEFFREDDSDMRRQAMTKAVKNGLANASAYAAGAKLTLGTVAEISPDTGSHIHGFGGQFGGIQGGGGFQPGGGFVAGNWKVTSRVRVVCRK